MNELENLVVNGTDMDRKLVAEVLAPYVRLDKDNCNIRPTDEWYRLSSETKILIYLLARKAMIALNFDIPSEGAKATEVVRDTGLKSGTAHPTLRKLLDSRLVEQSQDRRYSIPNHAISRIRSMITE